MDENIINEYCSIIKNKIVQGNFRVAIDNSDNLIYNFPSSPLGYYFKGVCYFAMDKYETSAKYYISALNINPAFGKAYFNLGVCYFMLNNRDLALINFGKAMIVFSKTNDNEKKIRCIEAFRFMEGN